MKYARWILSPFDREEDRSFPFFFFYFDYFVLNLATRPSKVGWSSYSAYRVKIDKQWNI